MSVFDELKAEIEPYRNTLVIGDFDNVVRLVDVVEEEDDFYWVYDSREGLSYSSCVGGWIPLRGFIEKKKYDILVLIWNRNNIEEAI